MATKTTKTNKPRAPRPAAVDDNADTFAALKSIYPAESGPRDPGRVKVGRPAAPAQRHTFTVQLTDDEGRMLLEVQSILRQAFTRGGRPVSVSRGQVVGMALRFIYPVVKQLDPQVTDWMSLRLVLRRALGLKEA